MAQATRLFRTMANEGMLPADICNRMNRELSGDDRLIGILRNTHFYKAQQVVDTLASEVEKHRNGAEPNDDLTMMCLKII